MASTEQLTIQISAETMEIVRARVAAGEYSSESEVVAQALQDFLLSSYDGPDDAFVAECIRRYDHAQENPSTLLTLDEAFEGLTD